MVKSIKSIKKLALLTTALLIFASPVFAGVSGEALINVEDTTAPTGVVQGNRVKDLGTNGTTGLTSGVIACGDVMWDTVNTNFTAVRGDTTNGLWAQIKNFSGSKTPSDSYANPTDAIDSFSLSGVWDGSGNLWNRWASPNGDTKGYTSIGSIAGYLFNGSSFDRPRSGIDIGQALVDNSSNASNNITTNTTTVVKGTGGYINNIVINNTSTGATSAIALYNIASAGCTGTPASGYVMTLGTTAVNTVFTLNHTFPLGICAVTTGGTAANISVQYR